MLQESTIFAISHTGEIVAKAFIFGNRAMTKRIYSCLN